MALNCFEHYNDTDTKRLQVIYLHEVKNLKPTEISEYVNYAVSTIRNYIWKFRDLLSHAIDLFEKGVEKITELVTKEKKKYYAYVIYIWNKSKLMYLKIGFSNNPKRRMKELLKSYGATSIQPIKIYQFEDEESALTMENILRKYFKEKENSTFIRRDRFKNIECTKEDINSLNQKYEFVLNNF